MSSEPSTPDAGGATPPAPSDATRPGPQFDPGAPSEPASSWPPPMAGWSYQAPAQEWSPLNHPQHLDPAAMADPPWPPPGHYQYGHPQHLAGQYLAGPEPSRGRGWVTALTTIAVLVVAGLVAVVAVHFAGGQVPRLLTPPGASSTQRPSPSRSATPGGTPTPTMPSKPIDVLKQNPINALKVTAKCPAQAVPTTTAGFRKQVKALVDCQNKAWKKALAKTAIEFRKPAIKHYSSTIKSPCGALGTNFPASYCTADNTLYFSKASFTQGRYYRLAVAEFVIHEYAHHIQTLAKIFNHTEAMKEKEKSVSRRIELQAHCMAQYGLTHSGLGFTAADRADLEYQFGYTSDAEGHGSAKAERYWGRRGLDATKIGACNTWKAKAGLVK